MKKKLVYSLYILITCTVLIGCTQNSKSERVEDASRIDSNVEDIQKDTIISNDVNLEDEPSVQEEDNLNVGIEDEYSFIDTEGSTLATRINPPENFERIPEDEKSFTTFVRNLTLKSDGSPVLLYNGEEKSNQSDHVAVFDIGVGDKDLQQCADSIIRIYAEYYWSIGEYDKIAFHLTNGFLMEYKKWREGYRLSVNGNNTSMVKSAEYNDSYDNFLSYLEIVFMYAGTLSLNAESTAMDLNDISPGDIFIKGGSPGHCVLVIDIVQNSDGEKAFLLAQGYMPAQEFHVLKNPIHGEDPWYYSKEITYPLLTPQWTFEDGSLKRWLQ